MALDALGIPLDIPWRRIAWTRAMLHRRGSTAPPKWRPSLAVYAYALPLEDTEDEYPQDRIVYLKLSSSITGWTPSEDIPGGDALEDDLDDWQTDAWDWISTNTEMADYWPCLTAIAQIAIYPADAETTDDNYPYFIDFEPKKRELYEAVSETGEVLSGSSSNTGTQKGKTTTMSVEATIKGGARFLGVGAEASITAGAGQEKTELETSDESTERRETQGRTTQLSQMYQLFNGYHLGTNRAVFAIFARPHIASQAAQVNLNLINGERRLEGVQDMFLVAVMPRTLTGFCVDAWIDTGHKPTLGPGLHAFNFVVTRRSIAGCADFDGDMLVPVAPATPPTEPPQIVVGEGSMDPRITFRAKAPGDFAMEGLRARTEAADTLNLLQAELRQRVLSFTASSKFPARPFWQSGTFQTLGFAALSRSRTPLSTLVTLEYLTADQAAILGDRGIKSAGDLFSVTSDDATVAATKDSLWQAVLAGIDTSRAGGAAG